MTPRDPSQDDLDLLESINRANLSRLILALAARKAKRENADAVVSKIAGWMAGYIGLAWMMGASRTIKQVDGFRKEDQPPPGALAAPSGPGVAPVPVTFRESTPFNFREAIRDLEGREPRLVSSASEVSSVMRSGGFTSARSADLETTKKVLEQITRMEKAGLSPNDTAAVVEGLTDWSRSYADTVVRTTASTSYSMGRFAQAERLGSNVAMAFEIMGPDDSIARKNHVAAIGLVAAVNDPIWVEFMPPLGFNCRHLPSIVPRSVLSRRGLIDEDGKVITYKPPNFANAHRDPGFSNVVWRFSG